MATSHPTVQRPADGRRKRSRLWWHVHHWVGLKLTLLTGFILLTGTLAVFAHEIDWLINPDMRAPALAPGEEIAWGAIAENAVKTLPGGKLDFMVAPLDDGFAAAAVMSDAEGRPKLVYADPATGDIQGIGSVMTVQRVLRYLHRHLMLPNKIGIPIVSSLSILLLVSLATSFLVYKKWWRGFFKPVRWRDARTAYGDLHRLAGLWSLWFVLLIALTGLWYLVESLGGQAPEQPLPQAPPVELTLAESAAGLDEAIAVARSARPDLVIKMVHLPDERSGTYGIYGKDGSILVRERAASVHVSAAGHRVVLTTRSADMNLHQRISEMSDPLHFGTFGGIWTKIIWFVFGAAMTFVSFSGAAIYALRIKRGERGNVAEKRASSVALSGMGYWKYPAALLVLTGFILIAFTIERLG